MYEQPVGVNTNKKMPFMIANFLILSNSAGYIGYCFRRSSATMLASSGGDLNGKKNREGGNHLLSQRATFYVG